MYNLKVTEKEDTHRVASNRKPFESQDLSVEELSEVNNNSKQKNGMDTYTISPQQSTIDVMKHLQGKNPTTQQNRGLQKGFKGLNDSEANPVQVRSVDTSFKKLIDTFSGDQTNISYQ